MNKPAEFDHDRHWGFLAEAKDEPKQLALLGLLQGSSWKCLYAANGTGEVFASEQLNELIIEEAGRRIYESQQARLSDQTTFAARRAWRSEDVPVEFWNSYREDARAALSLAAVAVPKP
ncbi:hypothetical protein [Bradyrhizobium sp. NP1]|jgi:hypothetical protein|uniref:hypothetical protein n=1 Tax=Bradyrhizobium sp. NP1 TaxID=3049772 RepID=UPI0025A5437F|nr:hypothetical protein [Bradyrhizobium sp. NP1]WJR80681.1 hypothetical protein QOU61_13245 [Bradyrhizobium sp. NP1]